MNKEQIDCREYARQMRENAARDSAGNVICSAELWEELASKIESFADYRKKSDRYYVEPGKPPVLIETSENKQRKWISVAERLPSEEEYRDESWELIPFLVVEKDTEYPYRAFYDGTEWGDGLMKIRGITHWMPLPEPPKMKGGE